MARSKYNNTKVIIGIFTFDSKKEARRYQELKLLEKAGGITGLTVHPRFPIIVNDQRICTYIADFKYWIDFSDINITPKCVVEDVKGVKTAIYRLKKKLVFATYGITITEV